MPGPDFDGASRDDVLWRLFTVGSSCTRCSVSAYRPTGWLTSTRGTGRPKYRPIDDHQMIRGDLVTTSLRFMTWGCVTLLAVLSLLHTQDMVRTSLPGQLERFIAYAGSAAIAMVGYGLSRAVCGSLAAFGSTLAFSKTSRTFRPAGIRLWRISRRRHSERYAAGWPLPSSGVPLHYAAPLAVKPPPIDFSRLYMAHVSVSDPFYSPIARG